NTTTNPSRSTSARDARSPSAIWPRRSGARWGTGAVSATTPRSQTANRGEPSTLAAPANSSGGSHALISKRACGGRSNGGAAEGADSEQGEASAIDGHHRPGRIVSGRVALEQKLRGLRHHPPIVVLQYRAHPRHLPGSSRAGLSAQADVRRSQRRF